MENYNFTKSARSGEGCMELLLKENAQKELTVTIEYPRYDGRVSRIVNAVKAEESCLSGEEDGRHYKIAVAEIFYIESIEKRTFIYTRNNIYKVTKRLLQLEKELERYSFIRVSKNCLLNVNALECVKTLANSRVEAELVNGEKIIISRTYIPEIRKAVFKEEP